MRSLLVGLVLVSISVPCLGRVEGLVVWQPLEGGPRYIVPKLSNMTPEELATRLQEGIKADADYGKMENAQKLNLAAKRENFSGLPLSKDGKPNVAVILNRPNQMTTMSTYLQTFTNSFQSAGNELFNVPFGLDTVLSKDDLKQYIKSINNFDGLLGTGGDDVSPLLYGRTNNAGTVGDVCLRRDLMQSAYQQEYIRNGKGRVFFICGSMQRVGVDAGHDFHPDINHITKVAHQGKNGTSVMVEVMVDEESQWAMATGQTRFSMLSNHHAGLQESLRVQGQTSQLWINAYNVEPDGTRGQVIKGFEILDPKTIDRSAPTGLRSIGMATQNHPEFGGSKASEDILRYASAGFKQRGRYASRSIIECMDRSLRLLLPQQALKGKQPSLGP